jgi:hypothetical protein
MAQNQSPKIALVAYESPFPGRVFVRVPNERGRYVLTDRCVVQAPCPHCGSAKGEPCKSNNLYIVGVHYKRRWGLSRWTDGDSPPKAVIRASDLCETA